MKRKRQGNSPKSGLKPPANKLGDTPDFFLNKTANFFFKNNDFQKFGNQFIQLFGGFIEHFIRHNLSALNTQINGSYSDVTPTIKISTLVQELNLSNKKTYKISRHIGCLTPELMADIHGIFHNNGLTGTDAKSFIPHFLGGETKARKIIWLRGDNLLTFTFEYLLEKLFPYYDNPFEIIAEHFCDAEGNDYTPKQLRNSHSKGVQKMAKQEMIIKAFARVIKKGDA